MMKRISVFALLLTGFCLEGCDTGITVTDNGSSGYRIVVSDTGSLSTVYGAGELQKFLAEMTRVEIPIISDVEPMTDCEIIIGNNRHLQKLNRAIDFDEKIIPVSGFRPPYVRAACPESEILRHTPGILFACERRPYERREPTLLYQRRCDTHCHRWRSQGVQGESPGKDSLYRPERFQFQLLRM